MSEWLRVMLEEIARKKAEAEQVRAEAQRRSDEGSRSDEGGRGGEGGRGDESGRGDEGGRGDDSPLPAGPHLRRNRAL
jgi:hypothetical protein